MLEADSLKKAVLVHRHALADSIRKNVVTRTFSSSYVDSLLEQIEHLHTTLNNITNESKYGFKTVKIETDLKRMTDAIQVISQSMHRDSSIKSIANLQMYRILLKDMETQLLTWRELLSADHKELRNMFIEMHAFVQDSFTQKVAADTAFANLHLDEMLILQEKWVEARATTKDNIHRISALQAKVSTNYFDVTELENMVNNDLSSALPKAFAKEYNYIWSLQNPPNIMDVIGYTQQSFNERMKTLKYYLELNISNWLSILVIGLLYFFWAFRNFRNVKASTTAENQEDLKFTYLLPVPVLSTFVFMLNIAPFYGLNQPAIYVEVLHLAMLIPLTIVFWRLWSKQLLIYWCLFVLLSAIIFVMNAIITPGWPLRFLLMAVNLSSVLLGLRFLSAYNKNMSLGRIVKWVAILYIVMNLLAIIANVSGRLTVGKIFTSTAIVGLTQITGLFVFVPMLVEAFYLQMKSRRLSGGMSLKFDYTDIKEGLYNLLAAAAIFCWLITFATNLEIYPAIVSFLDGLLNTPRMVGSTAFSIGNILTFIFIIYMVSILQKYVGYFFGETEEDFLGDLDKKESKLVLFRLAIIMVGFFLAVVASGLPVDKVTVVLGALGVGIGLGLQNIVFNLVSGIILIFEKPMQIGDYIEVADKKGRVQNIGIRSSKLVTADGSEVILPNGDILSSHMVNWTRSNNHRRTQLSIQIEQASEIQAAKDAIMEELNKNKFVIHELPVDILLNNLSEKSVELQINVWINSIYKEQEFRSEVLNTIYKRLTEKGIKMV